MSNYTNPFGVYVGVPALTYPWDAHIEPFTTPEALFQRCTEIDLGYIPGGGERPCVALGNSQDDMLVIGLSGDWWLLEYYPHEGGVYFSRGSLEAGPSILFRSTVLSSVDQSALIPAEQAKRVIRHWIETRELSEEMSPNLRSEQAYWRLPRELRRIVNEERQRGDQWWYEDEEPESRSE